MVGQPDPWASPVGRFKPVDGLDPVERGRGWLPYLTPLVFFGFTVWGVLAADLGPLRTTISLLSIAVQAGLFAAANLTAEARLGWRIAHVLVFWAILLASWVVMGPITLISCVFVGTLAALLLPSRLAVPIAVGWGLAVMLIGGWADDTVIAMLGTFELSVGVALSLTLRAALAEALLARTRLQLEQAILSAERERISRDVHDILGHSLTAIAMKADLADRLLVRDSAQTRDEITDIRSITRQALSDLRATTSGLREVTLEGEIASARAILRAAGVHAGLPSAVPPLPPDVNAGFGYIVREAVTNVARHARATRCWVAVTADSVSIADDGVGLPAARVESRSGTGTASGPGVSTGYGRGTEPGAGSRSGAATGPGVATGLGAGSRSDAGSGPGTDTESGAATGPSAGTGSGSALHPRDGFGSSSGVGGMRERIESIGGTLTVTRRPGGGTRIVARVPRIAVALPTADRVATP